MQADLWSDKQKVSSRNIIKHASFAVYEEIVHFKLVFTLYPAYRNAC